jgi:hypothetical protein
MTFALSHLDPDRNLDDPLMLPLVLALPRCSTEDL